MSADNLKLGELCCTDAQRDACHVAVAPVTCAAAVIYPGTHIELVEGSTDRVVHATDRAIGIVDPFLKGYVRKGDRFLMWLYPNTVTGMRHHWSHPAFKEDTVIAEAKELLTGVSSKQKKDAIDWMTRFASDIGLSYGKVMEVLQGNVDHGTNYCFGNDTPDECYQYAEKMWECYERITGKFFDEGTRPEYAPFRCAC